MKTVYPNQQFPKFIFVICYFLCPLGLFAQNLVTNADFSNNTTGWNSSCSMEVYDEPTYGGSDGSNYVTEIDRERCLDQSICVMPGMTFTLTFKASRRINASTGSTVGITVRIMGANSSSLYMYKNYTYNNTTYAYTSQTFSFSISSGSSDRRVNLHIEDYNNHSTYGVILDDIELRPQMSLSIDGPTATTINLNNNYSVTNSPAAGVTYNWTLGANANPGTSAAAAPSNISWSTTGNKTMSVDISNGTCVVTTLSQMVAVTGALPVRFTGFTGTIKENKAVLNWTTADEQNNHYFVIERSINGTRFDSVAQVGGNNVSGAHEYTYSEINNNATSYYRIRQVDLDGSFSFSTVIILKNAAYSTAFTVSPSLATATLHYSISSNQHNEAMLQVFNMTGTPVISRKVNIDRGVNQQTLDVANLAKGAYFLRLNIPGSEVSMIKQFQKL